MKSTIDIEALLIWAYRDQAIDRIIAQQRNPQPSGYASAQGGLDTLERYGTLIQSRGMDDCTPGSVAYLDASTVDARVMALDDAFVQMSEGDEVAVWDRALIAGQGLELIEQRGRTFLRFPDGRVDPLGRVVISTLLILHARVGSRPDCFADMRRRRGPPRKDGMIVDGITFADLLHHRAVYSVWHAALGILAVDLGEDLEQWQVTGPAAHESPWLVPAKRVIEADSANNSTPVKPLRRRRKSAA